MYHVQPEEVKRNIIEAISDLKTDKALGFLYNAYDEADNWGTKRAILKALYAYSAMGRKTFESLPKGALPNRRNIVLSTRPDTLCPGAEIFPSLEEALKHCEQDEQIYIIGGASVYRQALPLADALCLTEIDAEAPQADAYFPEVTPEIWQEKSRESHPIDEKHPCPYAFVNYIRR